MGRTRDPYEERVLVLAPTGRDGSLIEATLGRAAIACLTCANLDQLGAALQDGAGAVMLAEEALDSRGRARLAAVLAEQAPWSDVPIILTTLSGGEMSGTRLSNLTAVGGSSNVTVIERPVRKLTLVSTVQAALRARFRQYELRDLAVEVEHERHKLRALVMQAPLPIAILEGDEFRFTVANPAYLEMVSDREVLGQPCIDVFPDLAGSDLFSQMRTVYERGEPVDVAEHMQRIVADDGVFHDRFFRSSYRPLYDWSGSAIGVVVVHTELTAEVNARHQAMAANQAKDDFMAMLGHELRNPLSPILTALDLMRAHGSEAFARERAIIERQANHMARLVEDLLDVSRIATGKVALKRERVEIAEVLDKAVETATPLIEQARHRLVLAVPRRGLAVDGDVARLVQIFSNLLTNAGKYSDPESTIQVVGSREREQVVVQVIDGGRGIAEDMLPRVFELFVQERQNLDRSRGGLGLGLSIVRSLTELHGGHAEVASPGPGQGSTFTIRLPLVASEVDVPAAPPIPPPQAQSAPVKTATRETILIVDDNEDAATLLATLIERKGFATEVAFHGKAALAIAEKTIPQMAFLDIGLPEMDGYELCRRLRQLPGWDKVELIALTGYGQQNDRDHAAAAGFDRHLVKPLDGRTLQQVLAGGDIGVVKKID